MKKKEVFEQMDNDLDELNEIVIYVSQGMYKVMPVDPDSLKQRLPKSLINFRALQRFQQRGLIRVESISGKSDKYIFQLSHGGQQVKKYEPEKYKNSVNTPLRVRTRKIMQLANQEPSAKVQEKLQELYRSFPYHLLKSEPVNLRLRNFYFASEVIEDSRLKIYKAADATKPDPETDELIAVKTYRPKKTVRFEYTGTDSEFYYAVNQRNGEISNLLEFIWQEEIEF